MDGHDHLTTTGIYLKLSPEEVFRDFWEKWQNDDPLNEKEQVMPKHRRRDSQRVLRPTGALPLHPAPFKAAALRALGGSMQPHPLLYERVSPHLIEQGRDDSLPKSIINQLRPRPDASKHLVLIIGSLTHMNRKGILRYEIRYALRHKLPIILVFKGCSSEEVYTKQLWDDRLYPKISAVLRGWPGGKYCLVSPFTRDVVVRAIYTYSYTNLPAQGYTWYWR